MTEQQPRMIRTQIDCSGSAASAGSAAGLLVEELVTPAEAAVAVALLAKTLPNSVCLLAGAHTVRTWYCAVLYMC
jgi:hypothetical protein